MRKLKQKIYRVIKKTSSSIELSLRGIDLPGTECCIVYMNVEKTWLVKAILEDETVYHGTIFFLNGTIKVQLTQDFVLNRLEEYDGS